MTYIGKVEVDMSDWTNAQRSALLDEYIGHVIDAGVTMRRFAEIVDLYHSGVITAREAIRRIGNEHSDFVAQLLDQHV